VPPLEISDSQVSNSALRPHPDEATLKAHYILALERFIDETTAIYHGEERDLSWFPDMLAFAGRARVIAQELETKPADPFAQFDVEAQPV